MVKKYGKHAPEIDITSFIAPGSSVIGKVKMGKNSSVWYNAVIRGDTQSIVIGDNTNIQDCAVLHCIKDRGLKVGNNVTVGHGAILHSCTIGDNTMIGMGAIVLDGVEVGRDCLIGAGTLVPPNTVIPDRVLVLGSPAKVKRHLTEEEIQNIKSNTMEYVKLAGEYKADTNLQNPGNT